MGVVGVEIGVAFPERVRRAVVEPRVAAVVGLVVRVAAAGQVVAVGREERPAGSGGGGPIAVPEGRLAPGAGRVPVPGDDPQLGAQAVCDPAQAGALHRTNVGRRVDLGGLTPFMAVQGGAQRVRGSDGGERACQIDDDALCGDRRSCGCRRVRQHGTTSASAKAGLAALSLNHGPCARRSTAHGRRCRRRRSWLGSIASSAQHCADRSSSGQV